MLIDFTFSNFMSYRDTTTISFLATPIKEKKETTFFPPSLQWDYRLLRSIGVLGYNAAGKSNLIKALGVLKYTVLYSAKTSENLFKQNIATYLLAKNETEPTLFQVKFFLDNKKFRYGYKVQNGEILEEWLYSAEPKVKEINLFFRQRLSITINKTWNKNNESSIDLLLRKLHPNILSLSILGAIAIDPVESIFHWFNRLMIVDVFEPEKYFDFTISKLKDQITKLTFDRILKQSDVGFSAFIQEKVINSDKTGILSRNFVDFMLNEEIIQGERFNIYTIHEVFENENIIGTIRFDLKKDESYGTKRFFGLLGLFFEAFESQRILIIDELDIHFHFALYESLVKLFNNNLINQKGAQLLFTSHNTTLLKGNKIRRDQFYSVQKSIKGESLLTRFHEKGNLLRTDASLEKEYEQRTLRKGLGKGTLFDNLD